MMKMGNELKTWCMVEGIGISDEQLLKFQCYAELLVEWNEKMNLTAIVEPHDIAVKHFIDSISLLKCITVPQDASVIDIGTGAGFPGIPLKIMRNDIKLSLLDSLNKRLIFLQTVCETLELESNRIHSRAEDGGRNPQMREKYDIAVSRAVANLPALCEYCLPYVKVGGLFIAMKGPDGASELEQSQKAVQALGGKVERIISLTLPDDLQRTVIVINKVEKTAATYPRRGVKINKQPLKS